MATNTGVLANAKPSAATETTIFKNDVYSSTTGTLIASCDGTGADTYNVSLRRWDQALTLDASTYKLHRGDIISNTKWTLSAPLPLDDAIPGTKFTTADGEKCAYLLDVAEPTLTTYSVKYKSLIAFTLENVSDGSSSDNPDYANGETVTNGSGVSGTVYEFVPGSSDDGVVWGGDITGGSFADGNVLTGGSATTVGTVSTGGIATAVNRLVFNDGAGGTVWRLYVMEQQTLYTDRVYKYDVSDTTMSGINLQFSEQNGGTNASGTEWTAGKTTSGTAGSGGAYVQYDLSGQTAVSAWYPYDAADATYDDATQFFVMSDNYVYNEIYVYSQIEENLKVAGDWIATDNFAYRDTTYTINTVAGDSYGTVLEWTGGVAYVTNGPGSALWTGSDTFLDAPKTIGTAKVVATVSSVSNTSTSDLIIQGDAISASTSEERKGIIIGPGQSIKVEATNGKITFSLDAFQDTISEITSSLYQRTDQYQTDSGAGGDGGGD